MESLFEFSKEFGFFFLFWMNEKTKTKKKDSVNDHHHHHYHDLHRGQAHENLLFDDKLFFNNRRFVVVFPARNIVSMDFDPKKKIINFFSI